MKAVLRGLAAVAVMAVLSASAEASLLVPLGQPGETTLWTTGQNVSSLQSLGFTFNFFGSNYTQAYVNSNGNLTFQAASTGFGNLGLDTSAQRIAAFWDYLPITGSGGDVRGVAGTGYYAAIWNDVFVGTSGTQRVTAEAVLMGAANPWGLAANTIAFSYGSLGGVYNGDATVGIAQGGGGAYVTLAALVGGAANGKVTAAQLAGLQDFTYCFSPGAAGSYSAGSCNPQAVDGAATVPAPESSSLALFAIGAFVIAHRLRRG